MHPSQTASPAARPGPHLNALKHGLYAGAILLPDEDAAAFYRQRYELYRDYQPRTRDEAQCVETMARCAWRIQRCQRLQALHDAKAADLAQGRAAAGRHCEDDPHRWQHKSRDYGLEESRLDRQLARNRNQLLLLQKLRRNNLIAGALETVTGWHQFEREGRPPEFFADGGAPVSGVTPPGRENNGATPRPGETPAADSLPATPSFNGRIRKFEERAGSLVSGGTECPLAGDSGPLHISTPTDVGSGWG